MVGEILNFINLKIVIICYSFEYSVGHGYLAIQNPFKPSWEMKVFKW